MKGLTDHAMTLAVALIIVLVWTLYVNPDCRPESPAQAVLPLLE